MALHWLEQTVADVPAGDDWLSLRERVALAGLRVPKRRADWRLGRWTAKRAIAVHLSAAVGDVEVLPAASGAPRAFLRGRPAAVSLSISHSHGVACCALNDGAAPLGCDMERIEPRSAAFRNDYFTSEERAAPRPRGLEDTFDTLLWCAKESVLKALEIGLRGDPVSVTVLPDFSPISGHPWLRLRARVSGYAPFDGFWRADASYVRTLVEFPITRCPRPAPMLSYPRVSFT